MRTAKDWIHILVKCGVKPGTADQWADTFAAEVRPEAFSLGESEIDDFLSQILHESGRLERLEENLTYTSAERIRAVWPTRFKSAADAAKYVRAPSLLANKVYSGRMGNYQTGDGWKYRGSGCILVTGRANFAELEHITGLPLLDNPDLLRRPGIEALRVSIAWWEGHVPDSVMGDVRKVRRAVNGGEIGLEDTKKLAAIAGGVL